MYFKKIFKYLLEEKVFCHIFDVFVIVNFVRENAPDMPEETPNRVILLTVHNPFYSINTVSLIPP